MNDDCLNILVVTQRFNFHFKNTSYTQVWWSKSISSNLESSVSSNQLCEGSMTISLLSIIDKGGLKSSNNLSMIIPPISGCPRACTWVNVLQGLCCQ